MPPLLEVNKSADDVRICNVLLGLGFLVCIGANAVDLGAFVADSIVHKKHIQEMPFVWNTRL